MSDYQSEVLQRLTRLETKFDDGINEKIESIDEWIKARPQVVDDKLEAIHEWIEARPKVCPIIERKTVWTRPVALIVLTAAAVKLFDVLGHVFEKVIGVIGLIP